MVGRIALVVVTCLLVAPVAGHANPTAGKASSVKAPAKSGTKAKGNPATAGAATPTATVAAAPAPAPTAAAGSTCAQDPATELACLRRENEQLRRQVADLLAAEKSRQDRMAKQLGGGKAINELK